MASNGIIPLRPLNILLVLLSITTLVASHEHHEELPEGQVITFDPVDSILWTHIIFMTLSFGVIFPTGMVTIFNRLIINIIGSGIVKITMACPCSGPGQCFSKCQAF